MERRLDPRLRGAAAAASDHLQAVGEDTAEGSSVKDEVQPRKRSDSVTSECSLHIEHSHAGGLVNIRDALKFSLLFWAITATSLR